MASLSRMLRILGPVAVLLFSAPAHAHRPMVNGVTCGSQFATLAEALPVPRISEYWGVHRTVTCDGPVLWVKFDAGSNRLQVDISVGSLHPASSGGSASRFDGLQVQALVAGRVFASDSAAAPLDLNSSALEIAAPSSMRTGKLLQSPADVSTCAHSRTLHPQGYAGVESGMCAFGDRYGASTVYSSVMLDESVWVEGEVTVAFWFRGLRSGKMWVMVGTMMTGPQDFFGGGRIPSGRCGCVNSYGSASSHDDFSGSTDFWELETDSVAAVPLVAECVNSSSPAFHDNCRAPASTTAVAHVHTSTTMPMHSGMGNGSMHSGMGNGSMPMHGHMDNMTGNSTGMHMHHNMSDGMGNSSDMGSHGGVHGNHSGHHQGGGAHGNHTGHGGHQMMGCGSECPIRTSLEADGMRMHSKMAVHFVCDPALDFVRSMLPHHQGAVEMCASLRTSQEYLDVTLVHFCEHVRLEQNREIAGMEAWLRGRSQGRGMECGDGSMGCGDLTCGSSQGFLAANAKMHRAMAVNYSCDAEVDFTQGMLPHHQGGVDMCAVYLASDDQDPYLRELCANVTRLQSSEMMWMHGWLQHRQRPLGASCYGDPVAVPCFDMLAITDLCHDLGGDGLCDCATLVASCHSNHTVMGRIFEVDTVCAATCGLCGTAVSSTTAPPRSTTPPHQSVASRASSPSRFAAAASLLLAAAACAASAAGGRIAG